jgi:hypothetical protein
MAADLLHLLHQLHYKSLLKVTIDLLHLHHLQDVHKPSSMSLMSG